MHGRGRARTPSRRTSSRARSERGELLIETLITISLVGLGVVAIVSALGTVIDWGNQDRATTRTEALLWSYAEALHQVPYESCTAGAAAPYGDAAKSALPAPLPDGTTGVVAGAADGTDATVELTVAAVAYWDTATAPAGYGPTCPASDPGAQALTLTARSGDGRVERTLTIYKRVD